MDSARTYHQHSVPLPTQVSSHCPYKLRWTSSSPDTLQDFTGTFHFSPPRSSRHYGVDHSALHVSPPDLGIFRFSAIEWSNCLAGAATWSVSLLHPSTPLPDTESKPRAYFFSHLTYTGLRARTVATSTSSVPCP